MGVDVKAATAYSGATARATEFPFPSKPLAAGDGDTWKQVKGIWSSGASVWRNPDTGDFAANSGPGLMEKKRPRFGFYAAATYR